MSISVFDLFSIGIGPSSSHTVGPIRAARSFVESLEKHRHLHEVHRLEIEIYGSLAMTGKGHGTDIALLLGLEGHTPEGVDPEKVQEYIKRIRDEENLYLGGRYKIAFFEQTDLIFHYGKFLPYHSNAMRFTAYKKNGDRVGSEILYSIGGGFIQRHDEIDQIDDVAEDHDIPFPFNTAKELLNHCHRHHLTIDEVLMENEKVHRSEVDVKRDLLYIWHIMQESVRRGCATEGILPGGLNIRRRAPSIYKQLLSKGDTTAGDPTSVMDWVSLFALAVNEENAAGGRIVTAPTNGAAGIIPAVLHYYQKFIPTFSDDGVVKFLLIAGGIGALYKKNASLSAAEMGCQGEVGVACSMAAGALCAILGGSHEQIENAAEIGMEHNLGLTCDPIAGLVQIPCIERNTMGAVQAINAARLSLLGDGHHSVSLDEVIETMFKTGKDMQHKYKETSEGGLATAVNDKEVRSRNLLSFIPVSLPEC